MMASALVFVFLMDNLTDFNKTLNMTLHLQSNTSSYIEQCDNTITDDILNALGNQLHLKFVPAWRTNHHTSSINIFNTTSSKSLQHIVAPDFENSLVESNNKDDSSIYQESNLDYNNDDIYKRTHDDSDCAEETVGKEDSSSRNITTVKFPESAPFLAAIFETLSNITAQTCAGTLISRRWVLTASSCVNLLGNLYANETNFASHDSHYTVVAGSTNPLSDGTAHNVTAVLLHPAPVEPKDNTVNRRHYMDNEGPILAMMRIEPEYLGQTIDVGGNFKNSNVMVYGWSVSKNDSGYDALSLLTVSASVLGATKCRAVYNSRNNDILCLINDDLEKNVTLLSSGGPVLTMHHNEVKMLAVVQTDEHFFMAYSLTQHLKWITRILSDK